MTCAACGAEHHAACALEGGGCSATGCAGRDVLVGDAVVDLRELDALLGDPARAARLARPRVVPQLARLVVAGLVVAAVVAITMFAAAGQLAALPAIAVGVIACAALHRLIVAPPRRNRRDPHEERRLMGDLGVLIPDPMGPVLETLKRDAPPAPPVTERAAALERCPACDLALERGEDDEAPAWFCHHCGAALGG